MDKPEFVYTTYIKTTPERLWKGLTEPEFTRRYWDLSFESDWQVGSAMSLHIDKGGVTIADPAQVVLEADPFRRLSYTWHTFTPEWGEANGDVVKLTVVHDDFDPGSIVLEGVSQGWPRLLSSLKTLLESGDTLPTG